MTLWAFLSDIHGNRAALERALEVCRARGVERYAFLGDYLGRGDPEGVIALVREMASIAIVGNRDLDWADRVSPESRDFVRALPRTAEHGGFIAAHGDARLDRRFNSTDLSRGGLRAYAGLAAIRQQVLLFGHTHHARTWVKSAGDAPLTLASVPKADLSRLEERAIAVVNVGTTGLPFPGKGPASFVLLEPGVRAEHVLVPPAR